MHKQCAHTCTCKWKKKERTKIYQNQTAEKPAESACADPFGPLCVASLPLGMKQDLYGVRVFRAAVRVFLGLMARFGGEVFLVSLNHLEREKFWFLRYALGETGEGELGGRFAFKALHSPLTHKTTTNHQPLE